MTITLRSTKGIALTYSELDGNFTDLNTRVNAKLNSSSVSTFGLSLINDNTAADARNTLGVDISKLVNGGNELVINSNGSLLFPTLTVPISDNANPNGTGQTLKFSDASQQAIIYGPSSTSDYNNAERIIIQGAPGYAGTSGEGGDVYLWAGPGGDINGNGGDIKIRAGVGYGTGAGGYLNFQAGDNLNGGTGGYINIESGEASTLGYGGNITMSARSGGQITLRTITGDWLFGANGSTSFPNNTILGREGNELSIRTYNNNAYVMSSQNSNSWEAYAEDDVTGTSPAWAWIKAELPTINTPYVIIENKIGSNSLEYRWTFDHNGHITFPGQAAQPYRMLASQYGYYTDTAPVVIFTGTPAAEVTKATIHVKGQETVGTVTSTYHQICEILIATKVEYDSSGPTTTITADATVYGVTHTSATPMATFDVQWNNTLSVVEITMVRDAAYTGVNAKVIATESVNLD